MSIRLAKRGPVLILLALSVAVGVIGYQVRTRLATADNSLPDLIGLVPGHWDFVGYLNLSELRKEPMVEQLRTLLPPVELDRAYSDFVNATGFEYQRDLDRVAIAATGDEKLVIADGRFDKKKIEAYATHVGQVEHRGDTAVYLIKSTSPGEDITLTFLGENRLAMAEGGDVAGYLNRLPKQLNAETRQRLLRVAGSSAFADWAIPDSLRHRQAVAGSMKFPGFESVRAVDLAIKPEGGQMIISIEGQCEDPVQAQNLSASLELLHTVLPAALADPRARGHVTPENAELLARLIHNARITADSERVRLLVTVTPNMLSGPGASR